jgi:hypothetical protein
MKDEIGKCELLVPGDKATEDRLINGRKGREKKSQKKLL